MSVRWKPMILISALFVFLAAAGLLAISVALVPGGSESILKQARSEAKAREYERAEIQYRRALQLDPKNARVHEEMASMLADWMKAAPASRSKKRADWLHALNNAATYGKQLPGPRRALLSDALQREESSDSLYWAKQLIVLDHENADANYVMARQALESHPADTISARKSLEILQKAEPDRARTLWIAALFAREAKDVDTLNARLDSIRTSKPSNNPIDQMARIRLREIDLEQTTDPAQMASKVQSLQDELTALSALPIDPAPGRDRQLGETLQDAQVYLARASKRDPGSRTRIEPLETQVEKAASNTFEQSIKASNGDDLRPYLAYAVHLLLRNHRERCLEVVSDALKRKSANLSTFATTAMELREVGVKAALADSTDPNRFDLADPFIRDMLASSTPRFQSLGHLFRGIIDLDRSGLSPEAAGGRTTDESTRAILAASALAHLKTASEGLKDVPTAQALYGVALILSKESAYGRQYLQDALRMGADRLDSRYQIWAAWSVVQAGYPEEAEPIVRRLMEQVADGSQPEDLTPTLHLLMGEIHQTRRTPEELKLARDEYRKAIALGLTDSPILKLRMAQINAQLGDARSALDEINKTDAGPSAEQLAVLTLKGAGRADLARTRLDAALAKYPDNADLVAVDAAMWVEQNKPAEAEKRLSAFLKAHPENLELSLLKARILVSGLNQTDAARALLSQLSEQTETSQPLVQLALLEMNERNYPAVEKVVRQIRNRWKDAAAADLLDAQLSFLRGNPKAANEFLDSALKKDPSNKIALFWKAQLDDLTGSGADAQRIFEQLVRDRPVKELDAGLPLAVAAEWSLASRALDKQNYDDAIARFQALLNDPEAAELRRSAHWKLASAYASKGQAKEARNEVDHLLADPKVTSDERVRAADVFRNQGDDASANAQLDLVLKANPGHPGAVAYRSLMLTSKGQTDNAIKLLHSALDTKQAEPPAIYLMLAAMENLGGDKSRPRAIEAIDEGLKVYPDSIELLQARYALMTEAKDPQAVAFVEAKARANPRGPARSLLVDVHAERGELAKAKEVLRSLIDETPKTSPAASSMLSRLAGFVAAQAAEAAQKGDEKNESVYLREAASLIADGRERFPDDLRFPRLECELAARSGDLARAKRLAQELADNHPSSPVGLVLLGGLRAAEGQPREAARAFEQALGRNPSDVTVRLDLARMLLSMSDPEEAVNQAETALKANPDLAAAVMIKAKALAMIPGKPEQVSENREKALALLLALFQKSPNQVEAAHLASDIQVLQGRRAEGVQTLEAALKTNPQDDAGLSLLVQRLTEPGAPASAVARARELADSYGARDERGVFCLALAVGFQKANRADLALLWAEKAASKIDQPIVHLTYGDILLARGEAASDAAEARSVFQNALREYDKVLKVQPDAVEAVNNKAWVLYRHFNRNDEALELAEGLTRKRSENDLPPEFLDTLGAIQAAVGHLDDAERTFRKGLARAPEHPILNFHLGRLLSGQPHRADEAKQYLQKARALKDALPKSMAVEVDDLLARVAP